MGVFPKNKRGYIPKAKNYRFLSLLILLLSVVSIRRKLLKTTYGEERSVHKIQKVVIYDSGRKKINSIIQILQPVVIDYLSTHSYKVDIS